MKSPALQGLKVGIVGGSIAGLATAKFLLERGASVSVFERSQARLEERGNGIAMDPHVVSLIGSPQGRSIQGRIVVGVSGEPLWSRPARKFMTAWSQVYSALHTHVPESIIRRGHTVQHCESQGDRAIVHCHRKPPEAFDLVVGADGIGSVIRNVVAPKFEPKYLGYVAVRGFVDESLLPESCNRLRQWADSPGLVNCYGPRTHFVAYWIPSAPRKRLNWMWYRNVADADLAEFMFDESGQTHHWSLPPGLLPEQRRRQLIEEIEAIFPSEVAAAASTTENFTLQPIYSGLPQQIIHQNLILLGDAAHIAVPHIGAGSSFAIQDAAELAAALEQENRDESLSLWASQRLETTRRDLAVAERLGHALQHEDHDWERWSPDDFETWWNRLVGNQRLYFESNERDCE